MNVEFKKEVKRLRSVEEESTISGVYESNESVKTRASIAKKLTNEKMREELELIEEGVFVNESELKSKSLRVIIKRGERPSGNKIKEKQQLHRA